MVRSGTGLGTLGEVRDESWNPPGGLRRDGGHFWRAETGQETFRRSQTVPGTLLEMRDGL